MLVRLIAAASLAVSPNPSIRPLLQSQGFDAPLSSKWSKIAYVGDIRQGQRLYSIYLYQGVSPQSRHGINRLIVVLNKTIFLGDYEASLTYRCQIRAQAIMCDNHSGYGRAIGFTRDGPPKIANIDGTIVPFDPAPNLRRKAQ